MRRPVALTAGEPAGIGLELTIAAWSRLKSEQPFYLIADRDHVACLDAPIPQIEINRPQEAASAMQAGLPVLHHNFPRPALPGTPFPENAPAVVDCIRIAAEHARQGLAAAMCTNPVIKEILHQGSGFFFPGQTEFLGHLFGSSNPVMMLTSPLLKVVPLTTHLALADVPAALSQPLLRQTLTTVASALKQQFGVPDPRICVAGLNPHAGESGLFGQEEIKFITPVIEEMAASGLRVTGPRPADTMFHEEARTGYDTAVCMYHDQALVPFKTLSFHDGVNLTLGLPIVRTSPDHGPALDIAGKGLAQAGSLIAAIRLAGQLAA